MYKNTTLKELMECELPKITYQKKLSYSTNIREVKALYRMINSAIFYDKLIMPKFEIKSRFRNCWGTCYGIDTAFSKNKSRCTIMLADRWFCRQWLITALAHEMVHQYQWDVYSQIRVKRGQESIMSHGPSFYIFRKKLKKHGIPLKESNDIEKWFIVQDLFKC